MTALAFTWTFLKIGKPIRAKRFLIYNWMSLQDAQVLVLLNNKADGCVNKYYNKTI